MSSAFQNRERLLTYEAGSSLIFRFIEEGLSRGNNSVKWKILARKAVSRNLKSARSDDSKPKQSLGDEEDLLNEESWTTASLSKMRSSRNRKCWNPTIFKALRMNFTDVNEKLSCQMEGRFSFLKVWNIVIYWIGICKIENRWST